MSDQDFFDEVFRRASDEPDIPFNEAAWTRMEQKLEREERRRFFWLWLRRGLLAVFLSASLFFAWESIQKNKNIHNREPNTTLPPADKLKNEEQTFDRPPDTSPDERQDGNRSADSFQTSEKAGGDLEPNDARKPASNPKNAGNNNTIDKTSDRTDRPGSPNFKIAEPKTDKPRQNKGGARTDTPALVRPPQVAAPKDATAAEPSTANLTVAHDPAAAGQIQTLENAGIAPGAGSFDSAAIVVLLAPVPLRDFPIYYALDTQIRIEPRLASVSTAPAPTRQPLASLGALIAPQVTSVGFGDPSKSALSRGFTGSIYLGQRWALRSDLLWTKQHFLAGRGEYKAPYGFWSHKVTPYETEGHAKVLEWALAARTEWLRTRRWHIFAHAGAVSWWVLSEECQYYYVESGPYPPLTRWWKSTDAQEHWFAMARGGVGVGRELWPGFEVQVDLFAQSPLKGIGNGKVDLYSQGIALSIHKVFYKKR